VLREIGAGSTTDKGIPQEHVEFPGPDEIVSTTHRRGAVFHQDTLCIRPMNCLELADHDGDPTEQKNE
jgi:hypothetical protein